MTNTTAVLDDLAAESAELDAIVGALADHEWTSPTPAPGWTIAHQIAHLAWSDERALWSLAGDAQFQRALDEVTARPQDYVDQGAVSGSRLSPPALLDRWRRLRVRVAAGLATAPQGARLPWYGPPMSATSMATARLMETFAHGQDVRDALGLPPANTPRLRNIAHLAFRTRDFAYRLHGRLPPQTEYFLELTGPGGERWQWGDPGSHERISGAALDFCLLATQRRHRDDVHVLAEGQGAQQWLTLIQTFAGNPGAGRPRLMGD